MKKILLSLVALMILSAAPLQAANISQTQTHGAKIHAKNLAKKHARKQAKKLAKKQARKHANKIAKKHGGKKHRAV